MNDESKGLMSLFFFLIKFTVVTLANRVLYISSVHFMISDLYVTLCSRHPKSHHLRSPRCCSFECAYSGAPAPFVDEQKVVI